MSTPSLAINLAIIDRQIIDAVMEIKRDGTRVRLSVRVDEGTEAEIKYLAMAAGLTVRQRGEDVGAIGLLLDQIASLDASQKSQLLKFLK